MITLFVMQKSLLNHQTTIKIPPFATKVAVNGVEIYMIHSLVNWREPNTIFICIIGALEIISKASLLSSTVPCHLLKFINQDGHLLSNHIVFDAKIILDLPHCPLFAIGWQAVTKCEQKAEAVLADVQRKGQALAAQELLLETREQEASLLQKELSAWSQRLQEEREVVDTERTKMQEKQWQIVAMERDVESKQEAIKQSEKDVDVRMKELEKERLQMEETQNHILSTNKDKEKNLLTKENNLKAREMEVDERYAAVSELKRSLVEERAKMQEMKEEIVREKSQLRGVDEAISESQITKKNADDAWARAIKAQSDSAEYLRSVEERVKSWEDELTLRESELLQQQHLVEEAEAQAKDDYQQSMVTQSLHFLLQVGSYNLQWPSVMC